MTAQVEVTLGFFQTEKAMSGDQTADFFSDRSNRNILQNPGCNNAIPFALN